MLIPLFIGRKYNKLLKATALSLSSFLKILSFVVPFHNSCSAFTMCESFL